MRIEVVDPSGTGLGLAIGLVELGHAVAYRGAAPGPSGRAAPDRMRRALIGRYFGGGVRGAAPATGGEQCELLVLVDVFADLLQELHRGHRSGSASAIVDPLQTDAGCIVYPERLAYFAERALGAPRVAVVDMSDATAPREPLFEGMPHARLFARGARAGRDGPWQPLPFLYNDVVLWLERDPAALGLLGGARGGRATAWDWAFCGTLDHPRYGQRRHRALAAVRERWPELRGVVQSGRPFVEVLALLASARLGLDLPGAGDLCFRLHECLALGVPVWRPVATRTELPNGLAGVVVADPARAPADDPDAVRAAYRAHYAPRAAADWLLARLGAGCVGVSTR